MKALIMAGGGGTRLWPLSRKKTPKQFHKLVKGDSLLQMTIKRLNKIKGVKKEDIYISTNKNFLKDFKKQMNVPENNLILEPEKRDNAAAIGLSLIKIKANCKNENEVIGMFPSDHIIENEEIFSSVLQLAEKTASQYPEYILTLGIRPLYAETGFGYIEMGRDKLNIDEINNIDIYKVEKFIEKPNKEKAEELVKSFKYLWNAGIFFFRIDTMLNLYKKYLPEIYADLMKIEKSFQKGKREEVKTIEKIYPKMQATSIDYGIIEKTKNVLVIPVDNLGWSDVGNFKALWEVLKKDENNNVIEGKNVILKNTKSSIIYGNKKLITCLGVKDMVIIEEDDVMFIASKEESQKLKELLKDIEGSKYSDLL